MENILKDLGALQNIKIVVFGSIGVFFIGLSEWTKNETDRSVCS